MGDRVINGVDLSEIQDEAVLQKMMDQIEDFEERKAVRARLLEVRAETRAKREEKLSRLTNTREDMLRQKVKNADDQKARTLEMYNQMAKSAPAGGPKLMDIGVYRSFDGSSPPSSGSSTPTGTGGRKDTVEDAIRQRQKQSEDRKKRILAAYDSAARSGPAGAPKDVNFDAFKKFDVSDYEPAKPVGSCTFSMTGGVPKVVKASPSQPGTPLSPGLQSPAFPTDPDAHLDAMERAIRARQKEAEERKRRTLAAYDIVAKSGAGPKTVCLEEFRDLNVSADAKLDASHNATSSFSGGVPRSQNSTHKPTGPCARC